jgi:hypothetical protein
VIQQRLLPPISAFLDEIRERRLTKCIGHWARKVPPADLGRLRQFVPQLATTSIRPVADLGFSHRQFRQALYLTP